MSAWPALPDAGRGARDAGHCPAFLIGGELERPRGLYGVGFIGAGFIGAG